MDAASFKQQVLPVHRKLYNIAWRITGHADQAEDVVQETFVKLWNMRDKLHEVQNIESFAVTVTKNLCLDRLRARHTVSIEEHRTVFTLQSADSSPLCYAEEGDAAGHMQKLIEALPEQQRTVVLLRDVEEYSFEEIEQLTGLTSVNIRVILSRARKTLREQYVKLLEYGIAKG